jgi:transposase
MHSHQTKDQFIELRAKGISLDDIIKQLPISKGTAVAWSTRFNARIQRLRAIELQAIQERILSSYEQDLAWLAEELKRVQQILRERDYGYVDTQHLYWYQGALMARIDKKCAPVHVPDDGNTDGDDDEKLTETDQN